MLPFTPGGSIQGFVDRGRETLFLSGWDILTAGNLENSVRDPPPTKKSVPQKMGFFKSRVCSASGGGALEKNFPRASPTQIGGPNQFAPVFGQPHPQISGFRILGFKKGSFPGPRKV